MKPAPRLAPPAAEPALVAVALHDDGCFIGKIRHLTPQEQWLQFVQLARAARIKRERDTPRVVLMRGERDRALHHVRTTARS